MKLNKNYNFTFNRPRVLCKRTIKSQVTGASFSLSPFHQTRALYLYITVSHMSNFDNAQKCVLLNSSPSPCFIESFVSKASLVCGALLVQILGDPPEKGGMRSEKGGMRMLYLNPSP